MSNFTIFKSKKLPHYGVSNLFQTMKKSGAIRNQHPLVYLLRKLRNFTLELLAYYCPVNSIRIRFHRWRGVKIGQNVFIGLNCVLDHAFPEYIIIEDGVMLAGDVYFLTHSRAPENFRGKLLSYIAPIHIKKGAWLGIRTTILPGVTVGEGSVISAGSVVYDDVPDNVVVRGNPAEIIKKFDS
jgi:acetyltransferase-like isoleucine patch superfamily enzyme